MSDKNFKAIFTTKNISSIPLTSGILKKYKIRTENESGAPKKLFPLNGIPHQNIYVILNTNRDHIDAKDLNFNDTYIKHVSNTIALKTYESDPDMNLLLFKPAKKTQQMVDDIYNSKEFQYPMTLTNFEGRGYNFFTMIPMDNPIDLFNSLALFNDIHGMNESEKSYPINEDTPSTIILSPSKETIKKEMMKLSDENQDVTQNLLFTIHKIEEIEKMNIMLRQVIFQKDIEMEGLKNDFNGYVSELERSKDDNVHEIITHSQQLILQTQKSSNEEINRYRSEVERLQNEYHILSQKNQQLNESNQLLSSIIEQEQHNKTQISEQFSHEYQNMKSQMEGLMQRDRENMENYYNQQIREMTEIHAQDKKKSDEEKNGELKLLEHHMKEEINKKENENKQMKQYIEDHENYIKNTIEDRFRENVMQIHRDFEEKFHKKINEIQRTADEEVKERTSKIEAKYKGHYEREISRYSNMETVKSMIGNDNKENPEESLSGDTRESAAAPPPPPPPPPPQQSKGLWGKARERKGRDGGDGGDGSGRGDGGGDRGGGGDNGDDYIQPRNGKRNMRNFTMGNKYIPKEFFHPAQNSMFYNPDQFNKLVNLKPNWDKFGRADKSFEESEKIFKSVSHLKDFYL